jgi:hypothetical protein
MANKWQSTDASGGIACWSLPPPWFVGWKKATFGAESFVILALSQA